LTPVVEIIEFYDIFFYVFIISNFIIICLTLITNAASYITVILDNSLVFRVTIPDAVLIQFGLLGMSKILLETCTC